LVLIEKILFLIRCDRTKNRVI